MSVYPFIEVDNAGNVKRAFELLKVSHAAYCNRRATGPADRVRVDATLTERSSRRPTGRTARRGTADPRRAEWEHLSREAG